MIREYVFSIFCYCSLMEVFFFLMSSIQLRNDKLVAVMLKSADDGKSFFVHRPNTAVQSRPEELTSLRKKYTPVSS